MPDIVLASNSPRRQDLMKDVGYKFFVKVKEVDESVDSKMPAKEVAEYLALKKNQASRGDFNDEILITADTVVIANGELLGKPVDRENACAMIRSMSGDVHQVVSAVAISSSSKSISFSDVVEVQMKKLTEEEIVYYVDTYRPYDKAGAYGIQEWIGMIGIESIQGSFYTVMGMPIHKVYQSLKEDFGVNPF